MKRIILLLVAALLLVSPAVAEQRQRPLSDAARELVARHPEWHAYDLSPYFVTFVPLGNGVAVKQFEGLPKKIFETPDVILYSTTANGDNTLRGELRYLKKSGKTDVLTAFKSLMKPEDDVVDISESFVSGDAQKGIYFLVYILRNGDVIYEKIHNIYDDIAVSYRMIAKNKSENEKIARDMVADYFIFRRCAKDNPRDVRCARSEDPI